jgi:signal transduction histidine kinase
MSYRSFKRVLGETNLERKCLILFAACLFLLITGAFWYAERNAEELVREKTKQTGDGYARLALLQYHLYQHTLRSDRAGADALREMDKELAMADYEWEILVPEGSPTIETMQQKTRPPNSREQAIVDELQAELVAQVSQLPLPTEPPARVPLKPIPAGEASPAAEEKAAAAESEAAVDVKAEVEAAMAEESGAAATPISKVFRLEQRRHNHFYYEPVYWREACIACHNAYSPPERPQFAAPEQEPHPELRGPLRVLKISLPSDEIHAATSKSRAILLTTAILTVFLSVTALYLIVRYVIVKPLNHLRDVSDEISRGNTSLRADIQTNDEFEDLAASFNRMLRHLVDAQEDLRKANVDLDAKLDQLAQANMQLHEMNRLKSDFLANMSHELRTPLNSIIGFSDVLRGIDALNDKQKRYVDNIGKSGRILLEMINDILDLAKMESGRMDLRLSEFSLAPVVQAQCDLVRSLSEEKNIDLEVDVEPDLPPMLQDQGKVQQILTNLLSNAIKFTPEGGRIVVSARQDEDDILQLTVEDTGVGIAEEDRHVIFEKFRQGSTVLGDNHLTRKFSGTGLGLSIVKELCRLLGGEITFESELGKGSTFTALLPWRCRENIRLESSLSARLDEVTKASRGEMLRGAKAGGGDEQGDRVSVAEAGSP